MNPRLHSCSDLERLDSPENDAACLEILLEYTSVTYLGNGGSSNVRGVCKENGPNWAIDYLMSNLSA